MLLDDEHNFISSLKICLYILIGIIIIIIIGIIFMFLDIGIGEALNRINYEI